MTKQSAMCSEDSSADDLHGNAPDRSEGVLLLVDVINDLNLLRTGPALLTPGFSWPRHGRGTRCTPAFRAPYSPSRRVRGTRHMWQLRRSGI
jgi:hypothetical protein